MTDQAPASVTDVEPVGETPALDGQPVLEFRGVHAAYGGAVVLQDVSFTIFEGETVGLVGRNGAGKTTALLSVYHVPQVTGAILIYGEPVARGDRPATRGVSLVPQGKRILPNLTVRENLELGRASNRPGAWTLESVYDLFPNLARSQGRSGAMLSGGEQQMLAIGRALMSNPRLLMLDEPTEGLAPIIIDGIVEALIEIRSRGTALLLVEQHIPIIKELAHRYLALRQGELAGGGPVSEFEDRTVQQLIAM